jgi:beta-N-acetylhexosaminidase
VIAYAGAFLAGLAQYDVLGCGKHFPGLGGGNLDSHRATPSIPRTWQQVWEQDLEPYRALAASLPLITVSHAAYPKIERPPQPASLSRFWIQDVLRSKLRYRGLVTSDDMEMGGVLQGRSPEEAAIEAIAGGTDLLEICQRADRILATHEALLREAERSPAFARCVSRAAKRVATAKQRLLGNSTLPRPLSAAGLKQLQGAQQRLREKIARAMDAALPH